MTVEQGERWRPLRTGLVDLFYYDLEEFHFHGGNLLLRGNNGTGKSKVLALTLPFLLDGELSPHRVEPDGDRGKRMEWNLLLGGRYPHNERLGYTWLEFGRRDYTGTEQFFTVGCGLKAVKDRGIAKHWFFVSDQRIGSELPLVNATRTALTRERLKEAIGTRGVVYDRATDYRRALDEHLFGLGSRYESLVSLLIQLRQPQLTKRPDERLLSHALTEALAPLDENLVTQVAEAFRSLDDERNILQALKETSKSADDFLVTYRRYAQVATKRKAAGVRTAHSRYEQLGRDLADQERAAETAELILIAAEDRLADLEEQKLVLTSRQRALEDSPEMRAARDLTQADQLAQGLEKLAAGQQSLLAEAVGAATKAEIQATSARTEAGRALEVRQSAEASTAHSATGARVEQEHAQRVAAATTGAQPPFRAARQSADTLMKWRSDSLSNLEDMLRKLDRAKERAATTASEADRLTTENAQASDRILAAETAAAQAGADLVAATRLHVNSATQLGIPDPDSVIAALESWVEHLDGSNPATAAIQDAAHAAQLRLSQLQATLGSARSTAETQLSDLSGERARLLAGGHDDPPVPHTRSSGVRTGLGAPFWKVIDFVPDVGAEERAGIEAALEASGILDAWVMPDGRLLDPGTHDVVVNSLSVATVNLARCLQPAINTDDPQASSLTKAIVQRILESIGLGSDSGAATWIDANGGFGNGVLTGRWRKAVAAHIGEGARERARRARITELEQAIAVLQADIVSVQEQITETEQRQRYLRHERDNAPTDLALREAFMVVRAEHDACRRLAVALHTAQERAKEALRQAEAAEMHALEFAKDVGLPIDDAARKAVADALSEYRVALVEWFNACINTASADQRAADAGTMHAAALVKVAPAREQAEAARHSATEATERYRALLEASGASVAELKRRLAQLRDELTQVDRDTAQTGKQERAALETKSRADGQCDQLRIQIIASTLERDAHVETLRQFATTGLLTLACPEVELPEPGQAWVVTPAVQAARAIDRDLSNVDETDRRWELVQQSVSKESKVLADGLSRHGHQALVSQRDDVLVVDVTFQGRTTPVAELAVALATEVEERQRLLSAHEREVLENHLVSEVAGTLQELITGAELQVENMNRELELRPTSTGMRLRLLWRTAKDAPAGLSDLRDRQLRQSTDVWDEQDRRTVGAFLQQQIHNERQRDDAGTWTEQLTRALDYRSWHDFTIQRYQDGQWRPASGPASGGERVLAASIPLFAAAASYYSSASPHAPRLIALDEAFAGVDDDSRAKCLGLLANFDLDVVMTSEREWGCYPQVPALAIAQLSRSEGIDAVLVTPWRWDGHGHRYQVPRPIPFIPGQAVPDELPNSLQ